MKFGREIATGGLEGFSGGTKGRIVGQRRIAAHTIEVLDSTFRREPIVIPTHWVEHGLPAHALEARNHVRMRVREYVSHVQRPADRGRRRVD